MKSKIEVKEDNLYVDGNKVIKAYKATNGGHWFATEVACTQDSLINGELFEDDTIYYGLVVGVENEWGNFSKAELEALIPSGQVEEININDLINAGRKDKVLTIQNDGKEIIGTNYFDSEPAKRGFAFLSMNAGCIRLLLPNKVPEFICAAGSSSSYPGDILAEIDTADHVIISRGASSSFHKHDMLEILFEDYSDTPYSIHMSIEQCDVLPRNQDIGYELEFSVWTTAGKRLSKPCYYRTVNNIPCLKPFPEHKRKHH